MNTCEARWISRKEIAILIGRSYDSVARSEKYLGLTAIRVNSRVILFARQRTIEKLKQQGLLNDNEI
jgi:hypothetical protein